MELQAPIKHSNYFHIKVTDNKKPLSLSFFKVNLVQVHKLSHQQGYALILKISPNEYNYNELHHIEADIINKLSENNSKWFKNDLSHEKIEQLFKSSIYQNELCVYYSNLRTPNTKIADFSKWFNDRKYSMPVAVKCSIKCDGLFIYQKKFNLRWTLTGFNEFEDNGQEIEIDLEERLSIEKYWEKQYEEKINQIDSKIQEYQNMIKEKEKIKDQLIDHFNKIQTIENLNEWDSEIDIFRSIIVQIGRE